MQDAFICDAVHTPIGRDGGALSTVRADDLAALPLKALMERNPDLDWSAADDLIFVCADQAGEDNRNVGRMAALLAGMPSACRGPRSTGCAGRAWMPSGWRHAASARVTAILSLPAASKA